MMDTKELKKLAEAASAGWTDSKLIDCPAAERFIDAASPETVMALIAENGRNAKNSVEWEAASLHWMAERDQLKAELECARGDFQTLERIAEKNGQDAERYRWLRDSAKSGGCLSAMSFGDLVDAYCDERIDQAMSKGEQS